jgi:uncharacterized small protein (DUF1192 family)
MSRENDELAPPPRPATHVVGERLDDFSVEELGLRIEALRAEIQRLECAREAKQLGRANAAALFRPTR